jgi:hypothetical protein
MAVPPSWTCSTRGWSSSAFPVHEEVERRDAELPGQLSHEVHSSCTLPSVAGQRTMCTGAWGCIAATTPQGGHDAACCPSERMLRGSLADAGPQASRVSTGHDRCPGWQAARCYAHVSTSGDTVPHSLGAFMHVAIHKKPRVTCRPWLMQLPARLQAQAGLLDESRRTPV